VVTVFATVGHIQMSVHAESTAAEIVDTICHYLLGTGRFARFGFCTLVIPPENANIFVRDGWTKADIRNAVFAGTTRTVAWAKAHGHSLTGGLMDRRGAAVQPGDDEATVAIAGSANDILVVIAGGPAGAFIQAMLPYGGTAQQVIRVP
jgi:hypothetical protein